MPSGFQCEFIPFLIHLYNWIMQKIKIHSNFILVTNKFYNPKRLWLNSDLQKNTAKDWDKPKSRQVTFLWTSISIFKSAHRIIQLIYSCFPPYHVPTNSVAPFSADVNTHTTYNFSIRSEEELTLETSALETPVYINQFTLSNQSIKRNYLAILSNDTAPQFLQKLTLLYS